MHDSDTDFRDIIGIFISFVTVWKKILFHEVCYVSDRKSKISGNLWHPLFSVNLNTAERC